MKEVKIKETEYKIGKLSAMKQMLILKRATAILGSVQTIMQDASDQPEKSLAALGNAISSLPDESLEFIVNTSLSVCSKKETGGGWAPIYKQGQLMYQDMDLMTMLALVAHVLMVNLKSFFQDLPAIMPAGLINQKM